MRTKLKYLILIFLPVLLVPCLDLPVKSAVLRHTSDTQILFMTIHPVANRGIIGGYLSGSAKPIFQIPMVTLGFFLLTLLYFIQLFAPIKANAMRFAISLFFGGIFSNVVDRVVHGYVIDYLIFNFGSHASPALNIADLIQFVGIGMIFVLQFKKGTFDENHMSKLWVSRQFQERYIRQLVALGFFMILVFGVFNFMFVKVTLDELSAVSDIKDRLLQDYLLFFASLAITFMLFLFLVGKALSAYVANPILKFEKYLRNLSQGNYGVFQIGEAEFSYLESLSDRVRDHLIELQEEVQRLKSRNKAGKK